MFVFEVVDREGLIRKMRERNIKNGLIVKNLVEEVINKSKSRVRVGVEIGKEFWTAKSLRQGCFLSPMLFNILIVGVEKLIKRVK